MGTRKGKRRRFERAFKEEAVKLSQQAGRTVAEVADGLGINANMLRRWQREHEVDGSQAFRGQGQRTVEAEETWGLRRELRRVTEERDILKKALAYFAEHQK
jgi:transposase